MILKGVTDKVRNTIISSLNNSNKKSPLLTHKKRQKSSLSRGVGCPESGRFGMWDVWDVWDVGCGMLV